MTEREQGKRRRIIFPYIFLAIQVVFLVWILAGTHSGLNTDCTGLSTEDCANAREAGTTIGVALIAFLWITTDIVVGGSYAVYRLATRGKKP